MTRIQAKSLRDAPAHAAGLRPEIDPAAFAEAASRYVRKFCGSPTAARGKLVELGMIRKNGGLTANYR